MVRAAGQDVSSPKIPDIIMTNSNESIHSNITYRNQALTPSDNLTEKTQTTKTSILPTAPSKTFQNNSGLVCKDPSTFLEPLIKLIIFGNDYKFSNNLII